MISHEASFDHSKDFTLLIFRGCVSKNSNIGSVKKVYLLFHTSLYHIIIIIRIMSRICFTQKRRELLCTLTVLKSCSLSDDAYVRTILTLLL